MKISDAQKDRTASGISVFPALVRHQQEKQVNSFKPPVYRTVDLLTYHFKQDYTIKNTKEKNKTKTPNFSILKHF